MNGTATTTDRQELPDFTGTLIPTVRVLQVVNPGLDEDGNATGEAGHADAGPVAGGRAEPGPRAADAARLYIGLLPPGEDGRRRSRPSTLPMQLLLGKKAIA